MSGYERSPHYGFRSRTRMFRVPDDEGRHDSDSDATVTDTHSWGDYEGDDDTHSWGDYEGDENGSNSHPTDDSVKGDSDEAGRLGAHEGDKKLAIVRWSSHSVPRTQTVPPSEPNCRVSYIRKFSQAIQRLIWFEDGLWQCVDHWIDLCTDAPIVRRARVDGRKQLSIELRDLLALVLFMCYDVLSFAMAVLSIELRLLHTLMEFVVVAWNCYALTMGMTDHVLEFD